MFPRGCAAAPTRGLWASDCSPSRSAHGGLLAENFAAHRQDLYSHPPAHRGTPRPAAAPLPGL